jgi:hypothetical protein
MIIGVRLTLSGNPKVLEAMLESLLPDNVKIPKGMNVEMKLEGSSLIIEISVDEEAKIDTLISTVDEVLEACEMIYRGIKLVK